MSVTTHDHNKEPSDSQYPWPELKSEFEQGISFTDALLKYFRVNPEIRPDVQTFEDAIICCLENEQDFDNVLEKLHWFCQQNNSQGLQYKFDPNFNWNDFTTTWKSWMLSKTNVVTGDDTDKQEPKATGYVLVSAIYEVGNLNDVHYCSFSRMEDNLFIEIYTDNLSLEACVTRVKKFCRGAAADEGYYDHKGKIVEVITSWWTLMSFLLGKSISDEIIISSSTSPEIQLIRTPSPKIFETNNVQHFDKIVSDHAHGLYRWTQQTQFEMILGDDIIDS